MRLLDFVEEENAVGLLSCGFGEEPPLLAVGVAGRRADETLRHVALHELAHVEAREGLLVVEEELGEGFSELGFSDARRPEEEERADGFARIAETDAAAADGLRDRANGLVLSADAVREALFHLEELVGFAFEHLRDRDARPIVERGRDVALADDVRRERDAFFRRRCLRRLEALLQFGQRDVLELAELREVLLFARLVERRVRVGELLPDRLDGADDAAPRRDFRAEIGDLGLDLGELFLHAFARLDALRIFVVFQGGDLHAERIDTVDHRVDLGRDAVDLDAFPRRGFVEEIDRRVRERAIGDVALRERDGRRDGALRNADAMVALVALGDAPENFDRLIDARRLERDDREAAENRSVLLVDLADAFGRRRRDDADLASREEGLQEIADAGAGRALAEERIEVLDDEDDLGVGNRAQLVDEGLEALLDFAAELRPGDERARVELEHARAGEVRGHVTFRDARRERADDGRFSDAGVTDDERMVLEAPLEDLHEPAHFDVASDDGIEFARARFADEVAREGRLRDRGGRRADAIGFGDAAARLCGRGFFQRADRAAKAAGADSLCGEDLASGPADLLREGVEEMLDADLLGLVALRFTLGAAQKIDESVR